MVEKILEMTNISKSFSGIEVLHDVDFTLYKGEVHALVGQNGAGKSTIMKILNGVYKKDTGTIKIGNKETDYNTPNGAGQYGISMVFQEFSLVDSLPVYQNIFLGKETQKKGLLLDDKKYIKDAKNILDTLEIDVNINPKDKVEKLSIGEKQVVEIAKALTQNPRILILDEPTASLTHADQCCKENKEARNIYYLYFSLFKRYFHDM